MSELGVRRYPADKREHLTAVIDDWMMMFSVRRSDLLSILMRIMWLSHTSYYVRYKLNVGFNLLKFGPKDKQGRFILTPEFFRMLSWIRACLDIWNPVCMCWADEWLKGIAPGWAGDASGFGFGGAFLVGSTYYLFYGEWSVRELVWLDVNHLELAAILFGSTVYGYMFNSKRTIIQTDNSASEHAVNSGKGLPGMAALLDECQLTWTKHSMIVRAKHIKGVDNTLPDAISRAYWHIVDSFVKGYDVVWLPVRPEVRCLDTIIQTVKSHKLAAGKATTGGIIDLPLADALARFP
jgi:hypothetical protein